MNTVLQKALGLQNNGQLEQAKHIYLEILEIQPKDAAANHALGLIEINLIGALAALPRLEIAVMEEPENEQFWVSYIGALMQSGPADSVADALELGLKYGLSTETAQALAADFATILEPKMAWAPASGCPVCAGNTFSSNNVLWTELITDWQLSQSEVDYINHQQGYHCNSCGNNLRSMTLAYAILKSYSFDGSLIEFTSSKIAKSIRLLEINEAGNLTPILKKLPCYKFVQYPEYDMTNLALESNTFDLVVHSDTLEHVQNPLAALGECKRVLAKEGRCIFTVPLIINRLTRSRAGLKNSYHGSPGENSNGLIVYTEFGADVWKFIMEAGFNSVSIHGMEYPAGLALEAR